MEAEMYNMLVQNSGFISGVWRVLPLDLYLFPLEQSPEMNHESNI